MQETAPNRLDEPTSLLVSPFGQPRDSHRRGTADSYAPQIRIVKGDIPVSPRSPSSAGHALQPEPVVTQGLGALLVALRLGDHVIVLHACSRWGQALTQ
jgi:hypothetical protein